MNLDAIRTQCAILYPQAWSDEAISTSINRLERAGFDVSFSIGSVADPCVDCDDPLAYMIATCQQTADLARPDPYDPV